GRRAARGGGRGDGAGGPDLAGGEGEVRGGDPGGAYLDGGRGLLVAAALGGGEPLPAGRGERGVLAVPAGTGRGRGGRAGHADRGAGQRGARVAVGDPPGDQPAGLEAAGLVADEDVVDLPTQEHIRVRAAQRRWVVGLVPEPDPGM